jgi:hypothetical protein
MVCRRFVGCELRFQFRVQVDQIIRGGDRRDGGWQAHRMEEGKQKKERSKRTNRINRENGTGGNCPLALLPSLPSACMRSSARPVPASRRSTSSAAQFRSQPWARGVESHQARVPERRRPLRPGRARSDPGMDATCRRWGPASPGQERVASAPISQTGQVILTILTVLTSAILGARFSPPTPSSNFCERGKKHLCTRSIRQIVSRLSRLQFSSCGCRCVRIGCCGCRTLSAAVPLPHRALLALRCTASRNRRLRPPVSPPVQAGLLWIAVDHASLQRSAQTETE